MRISKKGLLQFSIWISAFFWFYQDGFLQLWRSIATFSQVPLWLGLFLSFLLFFTLGAALIKTTTSICNNDKTGYFYIDNKDFFYSLFITLATLLSWFLWVLPQLSRPPNTYGDEDFHFQATQAISDYISAFFHGSPSPAAAPTAYRYGGLMYLLFGLFTVWDKDLYLSPLLQRGALLIPLLVMTVLTFVLARKLLKDRLLALLFSAVISTSPLLLAFTMDKYLDIGHLPLLLITFASLYLGVTQKNIYALTLCGISASLAPLVRENILPTTLLISVFLGIYGTFIYPKKLKWAILITLATALPFCLFYFFKIHSTTVDIDRLSLKNIFLQDYSALFVMSAIYLNPFICLCSLLAFFWKNTKVRLVITIILASALGQLCIYTFFESGWMPWSRNYIMFDSQFIFLALLGIAWVQKHFLKLKPVTAALMITAILFNLWLDKTELNRNQLFHEIEIRYPYEKLFSYLYTTQNILSGSQIYAQVPIALPYSFHYAEQMLKNKFATSLAVTFQQVWRNHQAAGYDNMLTFKEFTQRVPAQAEYLLFHWWQPTNTKMKVLNRYSHIEKPTAKELLPYKILFAESDPWSDGKAGFILLKKRLSK